MCRSIAAAAAGITTSLAWTLLNSGIALIGYYFAAALVDNIYWGRVRLQLVGFTMVSILFFISAGERHTWADARPVLFNSVSGATIAVLPRLVDHAVRCMCSPLLCDTSALLTTLLPCLETAGKYTTLIKKNNIGVFQFIYFFSSFWGQFGPNCTTFLLAGAKPCSYPAALLLIQLPSPAAVPPALFAARR